VPLQITIPFLTLTAAIPTVDTVAAYWREGVTTAKSRWDMSFNPRLEILPWLLEAGKKWLNTIGIYSSGLERTICSTEQSASSATSYKLPRRRSIAHLRAELQAGSLQSTLSKPMKASG
jgi:hypothetical protein